jgi:hypothetical protein
MRTVSLLPEWALPFMRFSIPVMAKTVKARLMESQPWKLAAPTSPYQRGQHWVRRFAQQAQALSAALAALTAVSGAASFVLKALRMLEQTGWRKAHRFLFSDLRMHLLGWGASLIPHGRRVTVNGVAGVRPGFPQTSCGDSKNLTD